ncbi:DUF4232 domain-containing protein [Saccharopolyspora sp. NPDC050389]|uniref:DUF4232 domain-containing protein n=1 Tax=Saccharopolyspora sp. NPDC050389 TaxID=3155516 RepID=UPI0033DA7AEB
MFKNSRGIRVGMFVAGAFVLAATTACSPQQSATTSAPQAGTPDSVASSSVESSRGESAVEPGSSEASEAANTHGSGGSAGSSGRQDCGADVLKLTMGESDGAAGHIYAPIQFTNTGSTTCTLSSAPGVSYVGSGGHQIGEPAKRVIKDRPVISLAPGETASAPFLFSPVAHMNPEDCGAEAAEGLRVYPPNSKAAMFLPLPNTMGCTQFTQDSDYAKVGVVQAGPNNTVIG